VIGEVKSEMKRIKSNISAMVDAVNNDVNRYNTELPDFIKQQIAKRKSNLQKLNDQNEALRDI